MYQQTLDKDGININPNTIKRIVDGAYIPADPNNTDYQDYLRWLDEGNEPLPADE